MVHAARKRDEQVLSLGDRIAAGELRKLGRDLGVVDRLVRLVVEDEMHVRPAELGRPVLDVDLHFEVFGLVRRYL